MQVYRVTVSSNRKASIADIANWWLMCLNEEEMDTAVIMCRRGCLQYVSEQPEEDIRALWAEAPHVNTVCVEAVEL